MRSVESLSKRQRRATPLAFAEYLLGLVREMTGSRTVAVLWCLPDTIYRSLPDVDVWDEARDARRYAGPHPVICHPPCGPWGKTRSLSRESVEHGIAAMEMVHRWGGLVEQPLYSRLFDQCGIPFSGSVRYVCQGPFGHLALKPTLLYLIASSVQVTPAATSGDVPAPA